MHAASNQSSGNERPGFVAPNRGKSGLARTSSHHAFAPAVSSPLMQTTSPDNLFGSRGRQQVRSGRKADESKQLNISQDHYVRRPIYDPSQFSDRGKSNNDNDTAAAAAAWSSSISAGSSMISMDPISGLVQTGWMHKTAPNMRKFHRRFFALWGDRSLYYFKKEQDMASYFENDKNENKKMIRRKTTPQGQIDMQSITAVNVSHRRDLPASAKWIQPPGKCS